MDAIARNRRFLQRALFVCGAMFLFGFACVPLYRIAWPDVGLSDKANLTRCKQAAIEWAEKNAAPARDRKTSAARYLKSLDKISWSGPLVRANRGQVTRAP